MPANPKPPTRSKADKAKQQAVLDRMQKDLDGYVDKYNDILDKRLHTYGQHIQPYWAQAGDRITQELKALLAEAVDAQRVPITQDPIDPAKYRNMQREIERLSILAQQIFTLAGQPDKLQNVLAYTYTDSYNYHAWGLEQATKLAINLPQLTPALVIGVLANPWLPDGNTYSDRIRANTAYLAEKMRQGIGDAVSLGWDWNKTARHIQDIAGEGYFNSVRLARTEMNRAASQASSHIYMQNADILDGKKWRATLDARTAPKDADNDGKVYELDYDTPERPGRASERIPNHPHCRCKYSPVVNGISEKVRDRIARGDGDTKTNFGERTYTKAKNYREYAKERGLPDLDERLMLDDPKRYLRRGEDNTAFMIPGGQVVKTTPAAAATKPAATKKPAADNFAAAVKDRIAKGISSEEHLREVGALVATELAKALPADIQQVQKEFETTKAARIAAAQQLNKWYAQKVKTYTADEYRAKYREYEQHRDEEAKALYQLQGGRAEPLKQTLARIRPMGAPPERINWGKSTLQGAAEARQHFDYVIDYLPTEWLEKSNAAGPMQAGLDPENRGYYQNRPPNNALSKILVPKKADTVEKQKVAWHELGHRFEYTIPGIRDYEEEFYLRRTKGEALKWMGAGYKKTELTRKDKFLELYMGKDYSNNKDGKARAYELLSMGIEGLYSGAYDMEADTDYMHFILGVMATL